MTQILASMTIGDWIRVMSMPAILLFVAFVMWIVHHLRLDQTQPIPADQPTHVHVISTLCPDVYAMEDGSLMGRCLVAGCKHRFRISREIASLYVETPEPAAHELHAM